jgi:hypothetical protein
MKKLFFAAFASAAFAAPAMANTHVADNLNAADMMFRNGMDGCPSVSLAIMAYNSPQIYGDNTVGYSEVKRYANRCNLRF